MSTMKVNRIENTSTASGGLDIDTSGNVRVTTLADSAGNNDSTPAEIASGRAKAWVNFNGTGTVAIRASYNVASITDNKTGDYTVNFTTAMPDANYCYTGMGRHTDGVSADGFVTCFQNNVNDGTTGRTTTSFRVSTHLHDTTLTDSNSVAVTIFR